MQTVSTLLVCNHLILHLPAYCIHQYWCVSCVISTCLLLQATTPPLPLSTKSCTDTSSKSTHTPAALHFVPPPQTVDEKTGREKWRHQRTLQMWEVQQFVGAHMHARNYFTHKHIITLYTHIHMHDTHVHTCTHMHIHSTHTHTLCTPHTHTHLHTTHAHVHTQHTTQHTHTTQHPCWHACMWWSDGKCKLQLHVST